MMFKMNPENRSWCTNGIFYEIGTCEYDDEEEVILIDGTGLCYEHLMEFPG